jgi:YVTN family beta-propeller protein
MMSITTKQSKKFVSLLRSLLASTIIIALVFSVLSTSFALAGVANADSLTSTIPVGNGPMGIAYDSKNGNMYVTNFMSNTVSVIDGNTNNVISTIPLGSNASPADVAFDSENGKVYVTNFNAGTVSIINGNTNQVIATIPGLGQGVFAIAYDTENGKVYVTNFNAGTVSVIDGNTNQVIATIPVGGNPTAISFNPNNENIYVADGVNRVDVINPVTNVIVASVIVGNEPSGIAFDSHNKNMYVTNFMSGTVSVIDTRTNTVTATISMPPGSNPSGVAFDSSNSEIYVTNFYQTGIGSGGVGGGGIISVIDDDTNTIVDNLLVDSTPEDIVFDSATGQIYTTDFLSNTVDVISPFGTTDPQQGIQALIQRIQSMSSIDPGTKTGLISTLNAALSIISSTNFPGSYIQQQACSELNVFNNQLYSGVVGGHIDQWPGIELAQSSLDIQHLLGC